jgi:hypothetical protein
LLPLPSRMMPEKRLTEESRSKQIQQHIGTQASTGRVFDGKNQTLSLISQAQGGKFEPCVGRGGKRGAGEQGGGSTSWAKQRGGGGGGGDAGQGRRGGGQQLK